jgi:hypothetical protein
MFGDLHSQLLYYFCTPNNTHLHYTSKGIIHQQGLHRNTRWSTQGSRGVTTRKLDFLNVRPNTPISRRAKQCISSNPFTPTLPLLHVVPPATYTPCNVHPLQHSLPMHGKGTPNHHIGQSDTSHHHLHHTKMANVDVFYCPVV